MKHIFCCAGFERKVLKQIEKFIFTSQCRIRELPGYVEKLIRSGIAVFERVAEKNWLIGKRANNRHEHTRPW